MLVGARPVRVRLRRVGSPATAAKEATERVPPATMAEKRAAVRPVVTRASEKVSWSWLSTAVMAVIRGGAVSLTVSEKVSLTEAPEGSVAVTRRLKVALSASAGVPEKLRVVELKLSHAGRDAPAGVPSSRRALVERVSAGSGSVKVPAGRV